MPVINRFAEFQTEMEQWRHDLHENPQTAYEEEFASAYVAEKLESFGIEVHRGFGKTGVVGVLTGNKGNSDNSIGLRADMDALDMEERTGLPYASKNDGKMHGCGHDGHTATLLGTAKYLAENPDFDGRVVFIFQPAEEGGNGAEAMIKDGLLEKFGCDRIFGLHNWPWLPFGKAEVCSGPMLAGADMFTVTYTGQGGHAAMPHGNDDVIVAATQAVTSIQTIASRKIDPQDCAVVSVCNIHGGDALNVMPDSVSFGGTIRTFMPETRDFVMKQVEHIARAIAEQHGIEMDIAFQPGTPATHNTEAEADMARTAIEEVLGADNVGTFKPVMVAEDFSFYTQNRPGCFIAVGQGEADKPSSRENLHSPYYDFNDALLPVGSSFFVRLVDNLLGEKSQPGKAAA